MRIGILPLGRPTFDVPFAEEKLGQILAQLSSADYEIVGPSELLFDDEAAKDALGDIAKANVDRLLVLQVTFTDASMVVAAANALAVPLSIWAVPEPRNGGRLRLNAFCGLNLASHALGLNGRSFSWLYADPQGVSGSDIDNLLSGEGETKGLHATSLPPTTDEGRTICNALKGSKIGRLGEHPIGFDTCAYEPAKLEELAGVSVDHIELDDLFDRARNSNVNDTKNLRNALDTQVPDAGELDQEQLDRSLRLKLGMDELRKEGGYSAFAVRCWPETFTEYGGAMCGPASMLGEAKVPCACEADVYGALTQLVLQKATDDAVFLTDLVDVDVADNTAVVWHCGQAPISMRDPSQTPTATVHTNRKQPLLYQFALKPGTVTLMRISQAHGQTKMILSCAEMLSRPMAYTGTSGVLRFEKDAQSVLNDIMNSGLEHHMALAYGDHRDILRATAGAMGLPVLEI